MGSMGPAVVLPGSTTGMVPMRVDDLPADIAQRLRQPSGFVLDPMQFLTRFDYGSVSQLPSGQTLREYTLIAQDAQLEVAPGIKGHELIRRFVKAARSMNGVMPL